MSSHSALGIASITAIFKSLLGNELVRQLADTPIGDVAVSTLPPDRISVGTEERTQLNLYLYRVTPNSSWHRPGLSDTRKVPADRLPLALDLHYILSAYGEREFQAELLLGYAIQFFHEMPVLTQEVLRAVLVSLSSTHDSGGLQSLLKILATSTLAEQLQEVKISPEFLSTEEMSRLWSSLQTRSRLAMTY